MFALYAAALQMDRRERTQVSDHADTCRGRAHIARVGGIVTPNLRDSIETVLDKAPVLTIAVLGDLMLDEWIFGAATRISQEAPVPVVRFRERRMALGGATN